MINLNRKVTAPLQVARTNRLHQTRSITSLPAGKMVPLAAIPLLREDSVRLGAYRLSFEMMETAEILMNAVNVRVMAYLVPSLALDRFQGSMDILNRSYAGEPSLEGGTVIPYIETEAFGAIGDNKIYEYLGLHGKADTPVNTMYLESYNQIWNHRAANRSPDITPRPRLAKTLAPAFWLHQGFAHIVPDFDQAVIDGEVPLNITSSDLPVYRRGGAADRLPVVGDGTDPSVISDHSVTPRDLYFRTAGTMGYRGATTDLQENAQWSNTGMQADLSDVFAELQDNGITVSLSNIELARKTQAFARLREQYTGHTDEWLIGMLMDGLTVPDQALKQPMLLADKSTVFGMAKRYATDSGNLTESVVNGVTFLDLSIALPRLATGGVIMIVAEITPEQLFERQKDPFLHATSVDDFPAYLRDTLDPEKVSIVTNDFVDVDHDTPTDTFGYAPLNHEWNITKPTIGGRFYRPEVDAGFDEDRQRFWAVETQNPTLSADFYLCTTMHQKPFVVTDQDPFECVTVGNAIINGNTVFGGALIEASDSYDKVMAVAPQERIEKEA